MGGKYGGEESVVEQEGSNGMYVVRTGFPHLLQKLQQGLLSCTWDPNWTNLMELANTTGAYVYVITAVAELFRLNQWISAQQGHTIIHR